MSASPEAASARAPDPAGVDSSDGIAARQLKSDLLVALDGLDPKLREVFVLYDVEGLEMAEVAAVVGCPRFTGYTRLRSARKSLRGHLTRLGYGRIHE